MNKSDEKPTAMNALRPDLSVPSQNEWEIWGVRILLLLLVLGGVLSVLVPGMFSRCRLEIGIVPQTLIGFAVLTLVFYLQLVSQRKLLRKVSTALFAATSYVDRLEQVSLIDPHTQLFNRKYLDQLFNQQLGWLNRCGKPATLVVFEVLPHRPEISAEEIVIEAALVLRSTFRGSDYILRNSDHQFLALLPDTTEDQAQYALNRLNDKVDTWNLENEKFEMVLRHVLSTCPPGGSLWETLRQVEGRLLEKPDHQSDRGFAGTHLGGERPSLV